MRSNLNRHRPLEDVAISSIRVKTDRDGCLERLPYASLMATVMIMLGMICFTIMMIWGFNAATEQSQRVLRREKWPWLDKIQVFFVTLAVLMTLFCIFFIVIAFTATGATRESMYRDSRSRNGGRCAVVCSLVLLYILHGFWLIIFGFNTILVFSYHIFDRLCAKLPSDSETDCIDLSGFRPLIESISDESLRICGGDAQQFCALSNTAEGWFWVGWAGCIVVIGGIAKFIGAHAANYAHIGNASRYVELRDCAMDISMPLPPSKMPPAPPKNYNFGSDDSYGYRPPSLDRYDKEPKYRRNSKDERPGISRMAMSSSTHLAERHSDSVSQYNYGQFRRGY